MQFINMWIQGIVVSVVIGTIIEMILPNTNNKKYIKVIIGVYISFSIINPLVNIFSGGKVDLNSVINIDKYNEVLSAYKAKTEKLQDNNSNNIKEVYTLNLKKDIKAKIEDKNYRVISINIDIDDDENYTVKKLILTIQKTDEVSENNINNKIQIDKINTIEQININISNNENVIKDTATDINTKDRTNEEIKDNKEDKNETLSDKEISEIKECIKEKYNINKDNIIIN